MDTLVGKIESRDISRVLDSIDSLQYQAMLARATQLSRSGHYSSAEQLLVNLPVEYRSNPEVLDLLARIYAQQGFLTEAHGFWKRASQMDTPNPTFQAAISKISAIQKNTRHSYLIKMSLGLILAIAITIFFINSINHYIQTSLQGISTELSQAISSQGSANQRLDSLSLAQKKQELDIRNIPNTIQQNNLAITKRLLHLEKQTGTLLSYYQVEKAPELKLSIPGVSIRSEGQYLLLKFNEGLFVSNLQFSKKGLDILKELGRQLDPYASSIHIIVTGHTDDRPLHHSSQFSSNHELGLSRAARVVSYLHEKTHLPSSVFTIQGQQDPILQNKAITQADRGRMRTVTLKIRKRIVR